MNKTMKELEKAHKYFGEIKSRSTSLCFGFLYTLAGLFANIGADYGKYSFSLWLFALLVIYTLFKNAMDAAELGY